MDRGGDMPLRGHEQPREEGPGPQHRVGGQGFVPIQSFLGILEGAHQHQSALRARHGHVQHPHLLLRLLPPVQEQHGPAGQGLPLDAVLVHEGETHAPIPVEKQGGVLALPAELAIELRQEYHGELQALGFVDGQDPDHVALHGLGRAGTSGVPGVVHIAEEAVETEAAGLVVAPCLADQGVQIGLPLSAAGQSAHLHVQLRLVQQMGQQLLHGRDHALPPPALDTGQEPGGLAVRIVAGSPEQTVQKLAPGAAGA